MHLLHMHTHALPVTMTSPAVCLGPLPGFGRGWGGMLKKPGEAKHTVPQWGWRLEVREEGVGCSLFPFFSSHPLSLQRPHVCQPSGGASLLSILPIFVVPHVSLSLSFRFSCFLIFLYFISFKHVFFYFFC